jgi:hypothetical protein
VLPTGNIDHVQIVLADDTVQMDIDEILPWRGAPMADHERLDIGQLQLLAQQRIIVQIYLADREVVGGAPVGVHPPPLIRVQCCRRG